MCTTYTDAEPEQLRGPQHDAVWGDELGTWVHQETFDNIQMGLRLGNQPRQIYTTTPRPKQLIRRLVEREADEIARGIPIEKRSVIIARGSSYANRANLTPIFYEEVIAPYEGTEIGRQEIYGELLEEAEGALWTREMIDKQRMRFAPETLVKVVIGVDPAGGGRDETGIVVAGRDRENWYVLEDCTIRGRPETWASRVARAAEKWDADYVVAEKNYGGEMVESTIKNADAGLRVRMVNASRGKAVRAQPISLAYERGKVFHVGELNQLEDQMTNWVPEESDYSPDRLDALVWALTELKAGRVRDFNKAVRV